MPQYRLQFVREDDEHVVYTEHPDRIHPRELSTWLQGKYGKSNVDIYLLKNIYVIYINRNAVSPGEIVSKINLQTSLKYLTEYDRAPFRRQIPQIHIVSQRIALLRIGGRDLPM